MKRKILFVDDEKMLRDTLVRLFARTYDCLVAPDGEAALKLIDENADLALVVTDMRMPGMSGVELLRAAKARRPELPFIMLTAYGTMELAVDAMRNQGADDFFQKPITDFKAFELRIREVLENAPLKRQIASIREETSAAPGTGTADGLEAFTGTSPAMEQVYRLIRKVAPTNATVLVEGPSGTGKELVARALHNLSPRAKKPFVAVECAAMSKELLVSELFGYAPGTFTGGLKDGKAGCFEAANGGTLFLDEIGEIDADTQVKLLRAIESRTIVRLGSSEPIAVDFRLVAATNRDLAKMVAERTFREDLYYRLNVIDIRTPALREHPADIAPLVARFLGEFSAANGSAVTEIEPDALGILETYPWPGNVRQLRNVVEKMVILASGPRLTVRDLPPEITSAPDAPPGPTSPSVLGAPPRPASAQPATLAETEKSRILSTLAACGDNKTKAAQMLGISRRTLHRKLNEWGLS